MTTTDGDTPAAVGNRIAPAVIAYGLADGSNETRQLRRSDLHAGQPAARGRAPGTTMVDPNRWQPLQLDHMIRQNGSLYPASSSTSRRTGARAVVRDAVQAAPTSTRSSPGPAAPARPRHRRGVQAGRSSTSSATQARSTRPRPRRWTSRPPRAATTRSAPTTARPPAQSGDRSAVPVGRRQRGDFRRVIAEFWADGPNSETPPGHWNVIANQVADSPLTKNRIGGSGPVVDDLEWDVKVYFAVNAAVHDAAVGCWGTKRVYDSVAADLDDPLHGRARTVVDPNGPSYDPDGLPLFPTSSR